jgi:hypothetical protein
MAIAPGHCPDWGPQQGAADMTQAERIKQIRTRAVELAKSGKFAGWQAIEFHLRRDEGAADARLALNDPGVQRQLSEAIIANRM